MGSRRVIAGAVMAAALFLDARGAAAQSADDLFNDQVLQRIDLYVNTRDWYWLRARYLSNDYYPANLKWNGTTVTNVAIRARGLASRSAEKPALRVDFDRYATGRTFLGLRALTLSTGGQDPPGVREILAMKTYRTMGLPAPRTAPVALYVNNEYLGFYTVVEDVDDVFVARTFGDAGGYLFEYHWTAPYFYEYLGNDLERYAALYEAKTRATESLGSLYLPLEALIRTINEAFDEDFAAAVSARLDVAGYMRIAGAQAAIAERDGVLGEAGMANHYLYRANQSDLHRVLLWDASGSLTAADYPLDVSHEYNVLMRRALKVPALRTAYYDALNEAAALFDQRPDPALPDQPAAGWLEREASRLLDLVRPAVYADRAKPYSNEAFDAAAEQVLVFARTRAEFVRRQAGRFAPGTAPVY